MKLKRILAFTLSVIMVLSMLPVGVIASSDTITVSGQFIVENFKEGTADSFVEIQIFSETAENNYCSRKAVLADDNAWSVEFPAEYVGEYTLLVMPYSYGNVFPGEYEYVDEEGVPVVLSLAGEDVSGIEMSLPTGRMISGTIELPEDAVLPENPVECGIYADTFGNENGTYDQYFSNVTIKGQSTAFDMVVDYEEESLILAAEPWVYNESTNLLSDTVFYVNNEESSVAISDASELITTEDVSGVKLYLTTGNVMSIKLNRPDSIETGNIYGKITLLDKDGYEIESQSYRLYTDPYATTSFPLSKDYEEVYVSFYAGCSYVDIEPYSGTLYLNPDGSIVKTIDEAKPHKLGGLTSLEFTVPDEYYFSPKIKGTVYFEEGAFAQNTEISVVLFDENGYECDFQDIFDNYSSSGNSVSEELSKGIDFEFTFAEGSYESESAYAVAIDVSDYTIGKTNIYADSNYYYIEDGAVLDISDADMITPATAPDNIEFNIPIMKKLTGTIVPDGEFKYINGETEASVLIWCAHDEGSSSGGTSSGVGGGTAFPEPVSDIFEVTDTTENTKSECPLSYYYCSDAIIYKDLTFSCYVPSFLNGEHTLELKIENGGTNILSGSYFCTDDQKDNIAVKFTDGKTEEDISFEVETGYAVSGVVKMPSGATFEEDYSNKNFKTVLNMTDSQYFYRYSYEVTLSNEVREAPFMFAVHKDVDEGLFIWDEPGSGWYNTNLNRSILYYVNNTTTTETEEDAAKISVDSDIDDLVFMLKKDGEDETVSFCFKVYDDSVASASLIPIEGAEINITDGQSFSYNGTSGEDGTVIAELILGNTYTIEVSKDGYVTYKEEFEATAENAENMNYIPLSKDEPQKTQTFFIVIDKDTKDVVPNASISVKNSSTDGISLMTGTEGEAAFAELEAGTYTVITSATGYVRNTQDFEISGNAKEVVIEIEKIEVSIDDNTSFCVKDGDLENTPAISGASLTIEDAEGNIVTRATDSDGKATADLENGTYYVTAIADGYKTRSFKIEKSDTNNNFTVYLNKDDIIRVTSTVKEMTREEIESAGIDTDAIGNKQVYNCTAVLSFMPDVSINYCYTSDGTVVKGGTPTRCGNTTVTPVGRDIYLIVKSTTSWLKEIFEVQIVCDNTSAVETVEDLVANLTIPEGLSLAIMTSDEQTSSVNLGDIAPKGNASHKWYICGDVAGEYTLDGTLTAIRTGGGISENINLTFGIEDSITVLAGNAMTLTIDAESHATVGETYLMRYTLENVSDKTLYNLSFSVLGGKFFEDYGVREAKYAREYGPNAIEDLNGKGFLFETEEFKPGDKIGGLFEIIFGEELLLGDGQDWVLKEAFVVTGAGSTTVIPTTINWLYDVPEHDWDEGTVTKAATCTEDGEITFECKDIGCDETYTEKISATGHDMSDFVTVDPTCTQEGSQTSTCKNDCGHYVVLPISALGHDWETDFTEDVAPTCKEPGSKSIHCTRCDATKDVTEIPVIDHPFGDWQTRLAATCTEDGIKYRICGKCGGEETDVITKLGHDWDDEYTVDIEPGCTTEGSKSKHCLRCGEKTDILPVTQTGHSMGDWIETLAPTCTEEGTKRRDCGNCGHYEEEVLPEKGHDWDDGVVTTPSTEEQEGEKTFTCNDCGETKTESIPVLVEQQLEFARIGDITVTYGEFKYVDNMAYNDSENGSELVYTSSNTDVATVDENGRATVVGAGEATITATAAATDIYVETSVSYKLTVNKAELTVTPKDVEIFYGETPELKEYQASGFVFEEDKTVLTGEAVYETDYIQYGNVGTYRNSVSGLSAKNYNITFADGILTVKKAENYVIEIANLSQRKGSTEPVVTTISPKDDSAVIKVEYKIAEDTWSEEVPTEIGDYDVRASLVSSDNIAPKLDYYSQAVLSVKAGAMIDIDGDAGLAIETVVNGDKVEFNITDEDVETIINNLPSNGEVVIDAKGSTDGVKELTLPSNIVDALDESEDAKSLTILADDAEITMDAKVLETVADKVTTTDKVSIHIDAVEKEELNEKQQEALDTLGGDNAVILQLNLVVTSYENGEPVSEEIHQLKGKVDVRAAYTLPEDMEGKRVLVCYVADDGSISYVRAKYDNGFVSFTTNHFSHYAVVTIPCPHDWDNGTVITPATTSSTGVMRYTCTLCDETKDETIAKKTSGGGGGGLAVATYTVTYETNGGSEIKKSSVNKNATLTQPEAPEREGYKFEGWYTDKELTNAYDFSTKVTKNFTLYAKWSEIEAMPDDKKPDAAIAFSDVKAEDWFYENVKYVVENKLMNGVEKDKFTPNDTLTRAMLVTVLYRNAGEPATNRSIPFADVDMGAYYANAVVWAKQNGIVSGVTENEFAPNDNITREQIAAILFRYAITNGMEAVTLEENLHFDDSNEISEYAVSAMNWAVGTGLMKGKTTTTINPKDNATRAEIAAILQRFIEANK